MTTKLPTHFFAEYFCASNHNKPLKLWSDHLSGAYFATHVEHIIIQIFGP